MVGDVAQLGERGVRNAEARGSIPLISTKNQSVKILKNSITHATHDVLFVIPA